MLYPFVYDLCYTDKAQTFLDEIAHTYKKYMVFFKDWNVQQMLC